MFTPRLPLHLIQQIECKPQLLWPLACITSRANPHKSLEKIPSSHFPHMLERFLVSLMMNLFQLFIFVIKTKIYNMFISREIVVQPNFTLALISSPLTAKVVHRQPSCKQHKVPSTKRGAVAVDFRKSEWKYETSCKR